MSTRRQRFTAAAVGATAVAGVPASVMADSYVVHPHDTLQSIAVRHGLSVRALAEANGISNPNYVEVGKVLTIPDPVRALPSYARANPAGDTETYVVQHGDSLYKIAHRFGADPSALARVNGIRVNSVLSIGTTLQIPGHHVRNNALIDSIAEEVGVDPKLVRAVAWQESGWQQNVVSRTGAVGIMQIEPRTGEWISQNLAGRTLDIHQASDNVRAGALLLKSLLQYYDGNVDKVLAAYYEGAAALAQHGMYPDTIQYVHSVRNILASE